MTDKQWTLQELTLSAEERWRFEARATVATIVNDAYIARTGRPIADGRWLDDLTAKIAEVMWSVESSRRDWAAEAMRLEHGLPERIDLPVFEGCTDRDPDTCACGDPALYCDACGEQFEEGETVWSLRRRAREWLPLDHPEQEWQDDLWHIGCDHRDEKVRLPWAPFDVCSCISDDQATHLGPGFSRPVCAVHPEESA